MLSGCNTSFNVAVDAINHPRKPSGTSYRFTSNRPRPGADTRIHSIALAAVRTALEGRGLFEAPPEATPDMLLDVDYGMGRPLPASGGAPGAVFASRSGMLLGGGGGGVQIVREIFLKLSAREYLPRRAQPRGEELWDIHVSIDAAEAALDQGLPVLASAAIDYLGENSHIQVVVVLKRNAPDIKFIREGVEAALRAQGS
ncbi:MAG: hypothetical protein A3G75_06255 [Verrucomicrobia bacterium RIFCSPLOWO2_12_FULL_64_8]|nr:MAG: hypothetical protein A3G75_06255 [Verrucomicrobia bacterium RIFCSPLOWO2_12_FULL_64_8]